MRILRETGSTWVSRAQLVLRAHRVPPQRRLPLSTLLHSRWIRTSGIDMKQRDAQGGDDEMQRGNLAGRVWDCHSVSALRHRRVDGRRTKSVSGMEDTRSPIITCAQR